MADKEVTCLAGRQCVGATACSRTASIGGGRDELVVPNVA